MRLIDADAYIKMMEEKCDHTAMLDEWVLAVCKGGIKAMPTVEPERKNRKEFEKLLHDMFDCIWDCEIDHPIFQDTVGELMKAVLQAFDRVQPKPQKGKWIKGANHGLGVYTLTCDKCGYVDVSSNVINYCPNCGAKMEGEEHD